MDKDKSKSKSSASISGSIFAQKRNNSFQLSSLIEKVNDDHDHSEQEEFVKSSLQNEKKNEKKSFSTKPKNSSRLLSPINTEPALSNLDTTLPTHLNRSPNRNNLRVYRSSIEFYRLKLSRSKLKAVTRTSALLSGFAMVAMVELTLNYNDYFDDINKREILNNQNSTPELFTNANMTNNSLSNLQTTTFNNLINLNENSMRDRYLVPESILIIYSFVTCLLVGVNMLALMISICILPHVEASSFENIEFEQHLQQNLMSQNQLSNGNSNQNGLHSTAEASNNTYLNTPRLNQTSMTGGVFSDYHQVRFPHRDFHRFIELAWISSTVIGIFLFLVEIALVCYIKFYPISMIAALTGTIVMSPILVVFVVFTFTFYKRLAQFKLTITEQFLKQV